MTRQLNRQKCLIHLIRGLNDDLFKYPFDEEYKRLVAAFSELRPFLFQVALLFHHNNKAVVNITREAIDKLSAYCSLTVMSIRGMQKPCKIVLNPTRQTILVLARLIENGMTKGDEKDKDEMISFLPQTSLDDLKSISEELLKKGGLVDFYEHLKQL